MNKIMPSDTPSITANIIASIRVHITALRADFKTNRPLYALNWFNSRQLWLYNLYNFLAESSVLKVGGVPYFKARLATTLYGEKADCRSVLLIVRYSGVTPFKTMLQSRYFQLVSIIRGLAVTQFTFGLSTRTDTQDTGEFTDQKRISQSKAYAIHHYRMSDEGLDIAERAADLAVSHQVSLAFSSSVSARLYSQQGDKPPAALETIMDGCMILQADSQQDIAQLVASSDFQALLTTTKSSFIATLNRVF